VEGKKHPCEKNEAERDELQPIQADEAHEGVSTNNPLGSKTKGA